MISRQEKSIGFESTANKLISARGGEGAVCWCQVRSNSSGARVSKRNKSDVRHLLHQKSSEPLFHQEAFLHTSVRSTEHTIAMARPRKKRRTQSAQEPGNARAVGVSKTKAGERIPQSMVIRMGGNEVGTSVSQLVKDVRELMQPHTAGHLRERRGNKLRDFTTMAGPLGVTHFLLFSRSEAGNTSLRLAVTPRGPTLGFRVEKYSLAKDIAHAQRRPKIGAVGNEHVTPPLLVMNNFNTVGATAQSKVPKHLEQLATSTFQSLFPPISPNKTPLSSIRRVLLVNREKPSGPDDGSFILSLRHYAISNKPLVKLSRGIKKLLPTERHAKRASRPKQGSELGANGVSTEASKRARAEHGGLPNMGRLQDIADYVLDPSAAGYTSASDSEVDTDAEVEVLEAAARRVFSRKDKQRQAATEQKGMMEGKKSKSSRGPQKRAIKLTEIGPRMKLRMVKVEEGLCSGKVMWHEFYEKSQAEQRSLDAKWQKRRAEKEERRRIQKENILRKRKESGKQKGSTEQDEDADEDMDDLEDEDWDVFDGDGDADGQAGTAAKDDDAHDDDVQAEDDGEMEDEMEE